MGGLTGLLTAEEMRAAERAAMESGLASGRDLMERAGRGVADSLLAHWPDLAQGPQRAAVVCGPGNNGGDGFVVARLLRDWGWEVEAFLLGDPDRLPPDARAKLDRWQGPVARLPEAGAGFDPDRWDVIVDALFGTGLTRGLAPEAGLSRLLPGRDRPVQDRRARIVAVDAPSGLCLDSGRVLEGDALWADLTVTFHRAKRGHYLAEGPGRCGALAVVDIGLDRAAGPAGVPLCAAPPGARVDKGRRGDAHKYDHGHALVLSGGVGRGGAARLAGRAALRIGAGLVTLAPPPAALIENAAQLTAIMLRAMPDGAALTAMLEDARISALCLGPGLGTGQREAGLVAAALDARRPTVLDADALTLIAGDDDLRARLHAGCVLTPHAGEFARLFPEIAGRLSAPAVQGPAMSTLDAAGAAAAAAGCTVLLKGAATVVAAPDGRAAINPGVYDRAAPWLATAGAGDVLAGLIAGLMARGLAPMQAACDAAWLHVEAARAFGPGLIAEDLPEMLPAVLRTLA
ncbi:NAD(P)H-hydrate dehydratase [Pseudooceanicola sp. LIPI14-2-Ac024]|uniref:NAD(P)H-hydrate dehydratase n=1 Tax=Pseudooceanicola sp. LIPI14-2-Ac024 TaxID=3344875 RepID=UPI0035CF29BD